MRLFFKNIHSAYITVDTLLFKSVVLRPLLSFLINGPKMTLFEVDCWNDLFSLPFEKTGLHTLFSLIACAMRVWIGFCSGSLDMIGGDVSLITRDDATNRYSSGSIRHFCLHPNIRDK